MALRYGRNMDMNVQLPEFIAGKYSEVDASEDGAQNLFAVGGGITVFLLLLMAAVEAKDRIAKAALGGSGTGGSGIKLKGEL